MNEDKKTFEAPVLTGIMLAEADINTASTQDWLTNIYEIEKL